MSQPSRDPRRLQCLFVAADLPAPPDGGGRIATLRVLEAFSAFADIDLVALADPVGQVDLQGLRAMCRSVTVIPHPFTYGRHRRRQLLVALRSALSLGPYRLRKFRSRDLGRTIARLRAEHDYDVVHLDQFGVAPYADTTKPLTLVTQNIESDIYRLARRNATDPLRAFWARLEERKLQRAERTLLPMFDEVFVLTDDDAAILRHMGIDRVTVLPMPGPAVRPARLAPPTELSILSLGSMSWFGVEEGLLWFHNDVLPRIRARVPDVRWRMVGPNAGGAIRRLADDPRIELLGYVSDLDEVVAASRVGIVPLRIAGGIRMKLIDMMSWGLPSVSTSLGARGLSIRDGDGSLVRDDPAEFADAVVTLLTDDDRWRRVADAGRAYVLREHAAQRTADVLEAGVDRAIARHAAATLDHVHA
jgi:glycosyltransferase involved in cell wall biosynthesis